MLTTAPIQVMIVDNHLIVRESLKLFLSTFADLEVVAEASNSEEALKVGAPLQPDVVLLDLLMPDINGPTTTRSLREVCPSAKVLILTNFSEEPMLQETLQAGASGYLYKDSHPEELVTLIRAVHTNGST